ncbi:MAG TPA: hypothetical protein VFR37_15935 [Longimicrobium sp.]|nr:hypothetical protein [Longimicrobium sp.]
MEPPSRLRLLELWEHARGLHPLDRALTLAGAALPAAPPGALADLSVGERDAALLALFCAAFGPRLRGYADCPRCGERLEFDLDGRGLLVQQPPAQPAPRTVLLASGAAFRLPTSRDLAAVLDAPDPDAAARRLAALCRVEGEEAAPADLDDGVLAELEARLAEADPQADVELAFDCGGCGRPWRAPFDAAAWVWEEVEARATRLLGEVHVLARAYGWAERDILALGDARRAAYLELALA